MIVRIIANIDLRLILWLIGRGNHLLDACFHPATAIQDVTPRFVVRRRLHICQSTSLFAEPPPSANYYASSISATVEVLVPAGASVWINGSPTTLTGEDRIFTSPPLEPGQTYQYEVKAQWMRGAKQVAETQMIQVAAGQRSVADFLSP